jgi:hypothetical protein
MLHALRLAAAVAAAVGARLVVGHGGTERATGFLRRFGFRAFDTDPRWSFCRCRTLGPPSRLQRPQRRGPPPRTPQHPIAEPAPGPVPAILAWILSTALLNRV